MKFNYYKITNLITNKSYVGFTKLPIIDRWSQHIKSALTSDVNYNFQNAIRKYGVNCWTLTLLESSDFKTYKEAGKREEYWIDKESTFKSGYNMTRGGLGGSLMEKYSPKQKELFKQKLSDFYKNMTVEQKDKWINNIKKSWNNKSINEKEKINEKRRNTCKSTYNLNKDEIMNRRKRTISERYTQNDLKKINEKIGLKTKERYKNMTEEQKRIFGEKIKLRQIRKCKTPNGVYNSIDEAAENENIPKSTIYRWMRQGKIGYSLL